MRVRLPCLRNWELFYEEHGYFGMGHSRMRRAEILLEFAKERKPGLLPVLGEGLVYDLYERENLGSRPSWAADANEWKQMTRQYGKNGKQSHIDAVFLPVFRSQTGYRIAPGEAGRSGLCEI